MAWTLCTSGAAIHEAGANANATITASGTALLDYCNGAEAYCCNVVRYDVVTNFGSLTAQGKNILQDLCASLIAQKIVKYKPSSYSTGEATTTANILENNIDRYVTLLQDSKYKEYLGIS